MATKTIPQLPAAAAALTSMLLEVDDSGTSRSVTVGQVQTLTAQVFKGVGAPGALTPSATTALYFDTTVPTQPVVYYWDGAAWNQFIG